MKKNPVVPYAIIAVVGILLVVIISIAGLDQRKAIHDAEKNGGETQEKAQEGETAGDPEKIFQNNCASCHGADLSGGVGPALTGVGSKYSEEKIREIIKNGFPDAQPPMPGGLLQGAEAEAVAKWLSKKK